MSKWWRSAALLNQRARIESSDPEGISAVDGLAAPELAVMARYNLAKLTSMP